MASNGNISWRIEANPPPSVIDRVYGNLAKQLVDYRPAFQRMIPVILRSQAQIFGSQGGAIGEPWAPLSALYLRRKMKKGRSRIPMMASGKLRRDLVSQAGILSITKRRLRFGTRLPYARAIHFGQKRRLIGWTQGAVQQAREILSMHGQQLLNEAAARINAARTGAK